MHDFQTKLASFYSSRFKSFESSQHEHQAADYPPDVIELISRLEIQSVLEMLCIQPHFNALDIGAGGGRWTLVLADKVASVTAVEPSALCDLLKSRTKGFGNVNCIWGVSHLIYVVVAGCVSERWTVQPRYFTA